MSLVNSGLMIYMSSTLTSVHTPLAVLMRGMVGVAGGSKVEVKETRTLRHCGSKVYEAAHKRHRLSH